MSVIRSPAVAVVPNEVLDWDAPKKVPVSLLSGLVGFLLGKCAVLPSLDLLSGPAEEAFRVFAALTVACEHAWHDFAS